MSGEKWFIQKLLEIDQRVNALSRGGVGIGKSSIASGESLTVATDTGEVVFKDGGLDYVSGEVPPVPSAPTLVQDFGQLRVTWDGTFAGEVVEGVEEPVLVDAPLDLDVIEVHASTDPEEANWGEDTMRSQIKTREGGTVPISGFDIDDEVFVVLIALSKTGLRSEPSAPTSIIIEGLNFDQLFNELDAATTIINNAREILIENEKTLGEKLDEVPDAEGISEDIATARQEAIDAALAELDALEGTLTTKIDGKTTTQWSTSDPPASYTGAVGDTWIKLTSLGTGGREIARSKWDGSKWIAHKVDGASLSNVDASTITAGFLDVANRIRSGSIFADKLLIGGGANLLPAPDFSTGWGSLLSVVPGEGKDGSNLVRISASTSTTGGYSGRTSGLDPLHSKVTGGSFYRVSAWVRSDIEIPPNSASLYVRAFTAQDGIDNTFSWATPTTLGNRDTIPASTWSLVSGIVEMPEGAIEASLGLYVRYTFNHAMEYCLPSIQSATDGTLITPGGVQTPHLAADVLEVGNLKAGTAAIAEAVVKKLFAEVVVAEMVSAKEFIGENAILTGAVTAPKLTVTEEMWAKFGEFVKIRAGQIEADAIDGMVITGPNIRTAASGARVQMDTNGVRVFDEDNDVRTSLSPFGSTFKGEVEAETLVVNDGAEFKSDNTLAQGASLTLAAGVTDPTAPPVVQPFWDGLEFTPANINGSSPVGLAWDGTNYITVGANGVTNGVANYFNGVYAMKINGETGEASRLRCDFSAASETERRVSEVFGVTCIGSELFFLGRYGYNGYVWVTDLDGVFKRRFAAPDIGYSATNPLKYRPGIGNDGANLVTAQCTDAGTLGWGFISKTNGAVLAGGLDRGDATKSDITGVYVGNGDLGTKYVVVAKRSTATVQVFGTDGSATDYSWYTESGDVGIVFHDGAFHTLNSSGIVHEYTDTNTGDNSGDWWAAYRWTADATPEDATITHWSRISPPKRFNWPRRAQLRIMGQPLPVGVDFIGPVLAKKTSTPARTDFHAPSWWPRSGTSVAWYGTLPTNWETSPTPRDENNFPGGTPSVLKSANSLFEANGDGTGRWGPITWRSDGTIRGATEAGEVIVPINAANSNRTLAVTFPSGRFKTPPTVVATPVTPDPQTSQVSVNGITAAGFTMVARRTVASNAYVRWIATEG